MEINEFDKVLLKTDEFAYIADVLKRGIAYVVDIDKSNGDTETEIVEYDAITPTSKNPRNVVK